MLKIALWILQILLALAFFFSGAVKATQPVEALATAMSWVTTIPIGLLRFIGIVEILGAIGLILPAVARIRPGLTPLAALGLAVIMLLAAIFHVIQGESQLIGSNLFLLALSALVAYGRWRVAPIAPRTNNARTV